MKKHKNKIIAAVVIIAALAAAWFYGGNYNKPGGDTSSAVAARNTESPSASSGAGDEAEPSGAEPSATETTTSQAQNPGITPEHNVGARPDAAGSLQTGQKPGDAGSEDSAQGGDGQPADRPVSESPPDTEETPGPPEDTTATPDPETTPLPTMDINTPAEQDRYQTAPVPEGMPAPIEPQDMQVGDGSFTVTLTVRCDTILDNMNLLNREKHELVPNDGVIFPTATVTAYEGESVFNILQREMRRAGIHMTFRSTPIYNSAYIEAINNLYEFDVGELSGWMYCVTQSGSDNLWYPNYGCSRYQLQPGDEIAWNYSCNLGRDLPGGAWLASSGQAGG